MDQLLVFVIDIFEIVPEPIEIEPDVGDDDPLVLGVTGCRSIRWRTRSYRRTEYRDLAIGTSGIRRRKGGG